MYGRIEQTYGKLFHNTYELVMFPCYQDPWDVPGEVCEGEPPPHAQVHPVGLLGGGRV